jgi:hypothetical protein
LPMAWKGEDTAAANSFFLADCGGYTSVCRLCRTKDYKEVELFAKSMEFSHDSK